MKTTLSQKERMLLEDQKKHEQICIEKYTNFANQTKDNQLKQILEANAQSEREHLNTINELLSGNVPQMNQKQNQSSNQNQGMSSQGSSASMSNANSPDAKNCTDLLMTEKFVSGAYNTAIFEFRDPQVRDILNHIQKEEQQHGEAIFKYMESNGMYNVQ